ncbi:MAG: glucose-6-phosphate dehydrogenase [Vicinamibacteraceae bacterium]
MVVFGAGGDLTRRKLVPALINLRRGGLLPDETRVVAMTRPGVEEMGFRAKLLDDASGFLEPGLAPDERGWFDTHLSLIFGNLDDPATYESLRAELDRLALGHALFYMAVPPTLFGQIAKGLGAAGLNQTTSPGGTGPGSGAGEAAWRRIVVEKPFGRDLATARALNQELASAFSEPQIYRIDHYLGKETVQNLMVFRFANGIFEPVWNRRYIDHVQITVAEAVGVEGRGGYYETAGALRDMVQNHLFQLLALTAMEPPNSFEPDRVRDERVKVLRAIRPFTPELVAQDVVRGQYVAGAVDDKPAVGYREEPTVAPTSTTETYVALKLLIDNWRWADVPFYLRTGKRLARRVSEIAIRFKSPPLLLFRDAACAGQVVPNTLIVRIQPDEGIALRFQAKVPGPDLSVGLVRMEFKYADYFGAKPSTGYETLLYDVMTGDPSLFHRADMVETGWEVVAPILDAWTKTPDGVEPYPASSWGPPSAQALLAREEREWRTP